MTAPIASSSPFRGVGALLAEKGHALVYGVALFFGFAPALLFGIICALARSSAPFAVREIGLPTFAAVCGGIPIVLALPWTTVSQANTPVRRDELLVLPLGRLALPTAALVGSLLGIAAWLAAVLLGLALTVGLGAVVEGLTDPAAGATVQLWLGGAVLAFAVGMCVGSIGSSWALMACAWGIAPVVVLSAALGMGYDAEAQRTYAMLCAAALSLYLLVLPWLLYSRPRHIWTSSRQPEVEGSWTLVLLTAVGATTALGLFGLGWALAAVLAVGATLTWLARRGRPALRATSAVRLGLIAAIVPVAPLAVLGLVVDARGDVTSPDELVAVEVQVSPDERHVAVVVEPRLAVEGGRCPRTRRVVVYDVAGERAPIVLPVRFAELRSGAWSNDGRFLAVEDHTIGRLRSEPTRPARSHEAVGDPLEVVRFKVGSAFNEGWIVDTQTGEVEVRDDFEVAAGWTTPDELVTCSSSLSGDHVLRDGAGRELVVPRSRGALRVVGYAGGAVFVLGPHAPGVLDPTFGPVATELHRWDAGRGLVEHDPAHGARWAQALHGAEASPLKLTREGAALELDADVTRVLLAACDVDAIVAVAGEALVRISARDGARTVLVPAVADATLVLRALDPASGRAIVVRGDAPLLVDLKTGRSTPLPSAAAAATALVGEAALVASPGGWPALLAADGTSRAVRPRE